MNANDLISVIVATYNWEDALDAVLRALSRQSDRAFEIVIADDGSGPATANVVRKWAAKISIPVRHVWHEDRGFRKSEILNRSICESRGGYIIFLDGDCIPRTGFVAAHRRLAEPGWFVAGVRALLSPDLTARVLRQGLEPELWGLRRWFLERAEGGLNRIAPLMEMPLGPMRKATPRRWRGARGCNMASWRADLDKVDGFDTSFEGWGREDSDLFIRMIRAGIGRKDGRHATGVLHLWHREVDRSALPQNDRQLDDVLHGDRIVALRGISAAAPSLGRSPDGAQAKSG